MEESLSTDVESMLQELQLLLEYKNLSAKPFVPRILPRSTLINTVKNMYDEVMQKHDRNVMQASRSGEASNSSQVLRGIYYENVSLFKSQRAVDMSVDNISQALGLPQWDLGLLSTSKGLVFGALSITLQDGETIDCTQHQGGTLIPQALPHGAYYESSAKFGLIVEKDAAFQDLLSSGLQSPLNACIMITGKGYPDMNTRFLVRELSSKLCIPMFALIDGDPHGVDIFFNYKYGSMTKAHMNEQLAAPHLMWLGIHATDMIDLEPSISQPLSPLDVNKIRSLLKRSYVRQDAELRKQLVTMLQLGRKCEIENITSMSDRYLNDVYIPAKIAMRKFI